MSHNIIQIKNLNKTYGSIQAVKDLSFEVRHGEFFAFLGVNGAGKSTTISILCNTLKKDSGLIIIDNEELKSDSDSIKRKIGVVFQNSVLDKQLTVKDNLYTRASLYNMKKADIESSINGIKSLLDLDEIINKPIDKLSGGQKRRADIARALIHNPKILILDEPTTGLDPKTRKLVWDAILKLKEERKMTIFLTTHYMDEAADADYIVMIDKGEIAAKGTPYDLKNKYTKDSINIYNINEEEVKLLNLEYIVIPNGYRLFVDDTSKATDLIIKYPALFKDYEIIKGNMDDVFLNVTGYKLGGR